MRIRSWKVWALAAGFLTASAFSPSLFGRDEPPKAEPKAAPKADAPSSGRKVQLEIAVTSGAGDDGCKIEVKPANATCRFTAKPIEIPAGGGRTIKEKVTLEDVELRGADRNLLVAITIREAGGATKTVYRGYRVVAEPRPGQVESFSCWTTAPSRAAVVAAPEPAPTRR